VYGYPTIQWYFPNVEKYRKSLGDGVILEEGWEWTVPQIEESMGNIHLLMIEPVFPKMVPGPNKISVMTLSFSRKNPANSSG
jgi:hypothetical protein